MQNRILIQWNKWWQNKLFRVVKGQLVVIMDMICNMIYRLLLGSILRDQNSCFLCSSAEKVYDICVIWFFCDTTNENIFSCCDIFCKVIWCLCYIKRCCLLHSVISFQLNSFFVVKNVGDLLRNLVTQTFASLPLLRSIIFNETKWKRLITSEGRCWTNKQEHLEICCF